MLKNHVDRPAIGRDAAHRQAADAARRPHRARGSRRSCAASVVLPQPDGPRMEKKLPCATASDSASHGDMRAVALGDPVDLEVAEWPRLRP